MLSQTTPKSRHEQLVVQELADEILIYDLKLNKAFCLNQTAAFVWQHADGQTSVAQIAYLLQRKLKTQVDESVVWFALEQLEKDELLQNKLNAPTALAGMTRRQLITTLGKSAAVAIPLIFAITAPTPLNAASLLPNGASCATTAVGCVSDKCSQSTMKCCSADSGQSCSSNVDCCQAGQVCASVCQNQGGSGCVLYDTPIVAADGQTLKAIDVFIGQELIGVNCFNGEMIAARVKAKQELQASEIYSIVSESGDTVQCSPTHPLIAGFGDWEGTPIENFKVGDAVLIYDQEERHIVEAKTIAVERIKIAQPVILFEMDTFEHTFVSGGIVSHNKIIF